MSSFSRMHGYRGSDQEILVWEDAPKGLRYLILDKPRELGVKSLSLRTILCRVLRNPPEQTNYSESDIWEEVQNLIYDCPWFFVYDAIEAILDALRQYDAGTYQSASAPKFQHAVNEYFLEEGIGWQLVDGKVVTRGDEGFQQAIATAASELVKSHRPTAASHIEFALTALSKRPKSDTSGAVAHATNAVECLLHDITGEVMTLGRYFDRHATLFHPAIRKALDGVYGFASDAGGRHGREGTEPTFAEAQFCVTTCAGACTLLTTTNPRGR